MNSIVSYIAMCYVMNFIEVYCAGFYCVLSVCWSWQLNVEYIHGRNCRYYMLHFNLFSCKSEVHCIVLVFIVCCRYVGQVISSQTVESPDKEAIKLESKIDQPEIYFRST